MENVEQTQVQVSDSVLAESVTEKATVRKIHGQALESEHTVDVTYEKLADNSAIPADANLTHAEIIGILNARRKAAARATAVNALAEKLGIKAPSTSLDTDEKRIAAFVKVYKSMGLTEEMATQMAHAAVATAKA